MASHFSVVVYYGAKWSYDLQAVPAKAAVDRAKQISESVGAKTGIITRIMITDSDDYCVFDWQDGKLLFPTEEQCNEAKL